MKNTLSRRTFIQASMMGIAGLSSFSFSAPLLAQSTRGIKGVPAPELNVPEWIDGNGDPQTPFQINLHHGKWIYLKCFQEWCPACHSIGFPNLQKLVAAFPNNDIIVPAVIQTTFEGFNNNNKGALRKNQLRYDLNLPFGHDPGDIDLPKSEPKRYPKTMQSYRTGGTPWVVIIDPSGTVVFNDFHIDIDKLIAFLQVQAA
jgi:thiol-disulfide isomerase/thioredoxin